jgi:hypothetical protein
MKKTFLIMIVIILGNLLSYADRDNKYPVGMYGLGIGAPSGV